jgi:hypothetical protein
MKSRKGEDLLVNAVVVSALAVLAVVLWVGGRRLYARWQTGRPAAPVVQGGEPEDDGMDRPPTSIPPLSLVGLAPSSATARPRPRPPAARPMPPITPDRE